MTLKVEDIINSGYYAILSTGECLVINGYILESLDRKKFYPLNMHYQNIIMLLDEKGQIVAQEEDSS